MTPFHLLLLTAPAFADYVSNAVSLYSAYASDQSIDVDALVLSNLASSLELVTKEYGTNLKTLLSVFKSEASALEALITASNGDSETQSDSALTEFDTDVTGSASALAGLSNTTLAGSDDLTSSSNSTGSKTKHLHLHAHSNITDELGSKSRTKSGTKSGSHSETRSGTKSGTKSDSSSSSAGAADTTFKLAGVSVALVGGILALL